MERHILIVMELAAGGELLDYLARTDRNEALVRSFFQQLVLGVGVGGTIASHDSAGGFATIRRGAAGERAAKEHEEDSGGDGAVGDAAGEERARRFAQRARAAYYRCQQQRAPPETPAAAQKSWSSPARPPGTATTIWCRRGRRKIRN